MTAWTHCQRCGGALADHDNYGRCPDEHWLSSLAGAAASALIIVMKVAGWIILGIVLLFVLRWAYTEYWISQHCTTVLGTRVCQ